MSGDGKRGDGHKAPSYRAHVADVCRGHQVSLLSPKAGAHGATAASPRFPQRRRRPLASFERTDARWRTTARTPALPEAGGLRKGIRTSLRVSRAARPLRRWPAPTLAATLRGVPPPPSSGLARKAAGALFLPLVDHSLAVVVGRPELAFVLKPFVEPDFGELVLPLHVITGGLWVLRLGD